MTAIISSRDDLLDLLQANVQTVSAEDRIAEAGRKVMLNEFMDMLKHEAGSADGGDIEDVHDMRVATRRLRSTMRLLEDYYKPKATRSYNRALRKIARALGAVRDLDVLIEDIQKFKDTLDPEPAAGFEAVIAKLDEDRMLARYELTRLFNRGNYRRFVEDFTIFVTTTGSGARPHDEDEIAPSQVRHILPTLIYDHLGHVRAYETALDNNADTPLLHALRIEFKRLRYATSLFTELLGTQIKEFNSDLKAVQDHLGRIQDIVTAQSILTGVAGDLDAPHTAALNLYMDKIALESDDLRAHIDDIWKKFNTKSVKKLATAISAL